MFKKIIIIAVFVLFLSTPSITAKGAAFGLDLWYKALIPSLMPFMFLGSIIINLNLEDGINTLMRPFTYILNLKKEAGFAIFAGLFFGYPACASVCVEMVKNRKLDKTTAEICTCAFNNISPAFIAGFICLTVIKDKSMIFPVFLTQYLTIFLNAFFIRYVLYKKTVFTAAQNNPVPKPDRNILDYALSGSLINIAKLGGYVIIFSVITAYIKHYMRSYSILPCLAAEITSGAYSMEKFIPSMLMPFLYLGGVCGMLQTFAIDNERIITRKKYILCKTTGAIMSFAISLAIF